MQPDLIGAIVALFSSRAPITAKVSTRIFGGELPSRVADEMPTPAIVVRRSGSVGAFGQAWQEYGDARVDIFYYGATPGDAEALYRTANPELKQLTREVYASCLLHWAREAGGGTQLRDPDTDWPYILASYQLLASERSTT